MKSTRKDAIKPAVRPARGVTPRSFRRESAKRKRERALEIVRRLKLEYPEAECALHHSNPVQLLVATILSAQCTDERVNLVTPALFKKYPDAAAFAAADQEELERDIHSTGFFRSKARNIIACCQALVTEYAGAVPTDMDDLVSLAGVGRKTANVVRGACFSLPAITVDTHCGRLARRLGLTRHDDPAKVELDLQQLIPERDWWAFSSAIIWHGRRVCDARRPDCDRCVLSDLCPTSTARVEGAAVEAFGSTELAFQLDAADEAEAKPVSRSLEAPDAAA